MPIHSLATRIEQSKEPLPILSCHKWIVLYPDDGLWFCYSDRIIDYTSLMFAIIFIYEIIVY